MTDWDLAACKGMDINLFFPVRGAKGTKAKETCAVCPIRKDCLDYVMSFDGPCGGDLSTQGIWGGTSQYERNKMRNPNYRVKKYWKDHDCKEPTGIPEGGNGEHACDQCDRAWYWKKDSRRDAGGHWSRKYTKVKAA